MKELLFILMIVSILIGWLYYCYLNNHKIALLQLQKVYSQNYISEIQIVHYHEIDGSHWSVANWWEVHIISYCHNDIYIEIGCKQRTKEKWDSFFEIGNREVINTERDTFKFHKIREDYYQFIRMCEEKGIKF